MKKILFVIPLLLFTNISLFGQSVFLPGYIIKPGQDTIYGLIADLGQVRNLKTCHFKKNENEKVKIYAPNDLLAYRINSGKFYVTKEIELEEKSHLVFLEYLVNGIFNLYYANFQGRDLYFLENEEGRISELSNKSKEVFIGEAKYIRNSSLYKGVLKASFSDYPDLIPKIEKSELNHNSLIKLTKEYHEFTCENEECIVYEKQVTPMKFRFGPSFGVHIMKFSYKEEWKEFNSDFGINYFVGFLARLEFPGKLVSFEISGDYAKLYFYELSSSEGLYTDTHVYLDQVKIKIAPKIKVPVSKLRIGFSAGIQLDYYFEFNGNQVEESVSGGIVYSNYQPYEFEISPFQLGYFGGMNIDYTINKWIVYLNAEIELIPVKTETYINSQFFGFGLSTGFLF